MAKPFNAEEAENHEDIEKQFAVVAVEQAATYWSLLEKIPDPSKIKLTTQDDALYDTLLECFPQFQDGTWGQTINEAEIKIKEGKAKWRDFCNKFEKTVPDYNFGTLLRLDSSKEYSQENSMFAYRVQFYAIEIYRNRHGLNNWVHEQHVHQ